MKNNNVVSLKEPEAEASSADSLTELLRNSAKDLIKQVIDAELQELLSQYTRSPKVKKIAYYLSLYDRC